jgi:hypothetical protein
MSYHSDRAIDTRTCGDADEDTMLDRRDGLHTHAIATWIASNARLVAIPGVESGTCPFCYERAHAHVCAPLRAELMKEESNGL